MRSVHTAFAALRLARDHGPISKRELATALDCSERQALRYLIECSMEGALIALPRDSTAGNSAPQFFAIAPEFSGVSSTPPNTQRKRASA